MSHVSEQAIVAALKHSLQLIKIGESVEKFGNQLQSCNQIEQGIIDQEISQSIKTYAKFIQREGKKSLNNVKQLVCDRSIKVFCKSVSLHIYASQFCVEATKDYQSKLSAYLRQKK